jgi:hypothetical protein
MPNPQISQTLFERFESEWRQIRESAPEAPKPSLTTPRK